MLKFAALQNVLFTKPNLKFSFEFSYGFFLGKVNISAILVIFPTPRKGIGEMPELERKGWEK